MFEAAQSSQLSDETAKAGTSYTSDLNVWGPFVKWPLVCARSFLLATTFDLLEIKEL